MGRPLRAVYANSTYSTGIQEMSNSDILDLAGALVLNYVTVNRPLYTVLGINDSNTSAVSIGTVIDTNKGPVGSAPTNFSNTITFSVRAGTNSIPTNITRPVQYTVVNGEVKVQDMSDSDLLTYFFAPIVDYMSTGGQGAYYLGTTTGGPPGTGTWTSAGTLNDTYYVSTTLTTVGYTLWQRTDTASTGTVRPLKQTVSGSTTKLVEMTDSEMQALGAYIGEYIRTTGIGQYAIQASTPGTGTWVNRGSFTNNENNTADNGSYVGGYLGTFSAGYTGSYSSAYTGAYAGTYNQTFQGTFSLTFTGAYTGSFTGGYTGTYAGSYVGSYALRQGPSYQTATPTAFSTTYQGATYTSTFAGTAPVTFTGSPSIFLVYTTGTGGMYGSYTGTYNSTFTGYYVSIAYSGTRPASYTLTVPLPYTGAYTGAGPVYTGVYGTVTTYTPSMTFNGRTVDYFFPAPNNTPAWTNQNYAGSYVAPPVAYTGTHPRPGDLYYTGTTTDYYLLMTLWTGNYTGSYAGTYNNQFFLAPGGFTSYTGTVPTSYTGGSYTKTSSGSFTGVVLGTAYTRTYSGLPSYAGSRNNTYTGVFNQTFTGNYNRNYTGTFTVSYTGSYVGAYSRAYAGTYGSVFTGAVYTGVYTGLAVQSATTTNIYTLWVRTA